MPTVSIVIPCFTARRWHALMRAVESALSQTHPCDVIVVVDHNEVLLRRLRGEIGRKARVIPNEFARGVSGARNSGALIAASEFVAFLDDDAAAERTWIENLLSAYDRTPSAVGLGGAIRPVWGAPPPPWFPAEFSWVVSCSPGWADRDADVRNVWGVSMLVRRQSFLDAGGFRTGFGKLGQTSEPEDTDLCLRMTARAGPGARWRFVADAVVFHEVPPERATLSFFLRRCWLEGKGKYVLSSLSDGKARVLDDEARFVVRVLTRHVTRHLLAVVRGDPSGAGRAAAIVLGSAVAAAGFLSEANVPRPFRAAGAARVGADAREGSGLRVRERRPTAGGEALSGTALDLRLPFRLDQRVEEKD
jgi:GT2 family glycosyltransferase